MSKVVKLKQKEIEKIVESLLEDISDIDMTSDDSEKIDNTSDIISSKTQDILQKFNLEMRPGTDEVTSSGSNIGLGKDTEGNVYVVDYKTNKILGIKKN